MFRSLVAVAGVALFALAAQPALAQGDQQDTAQMCVYNNFTETEAVVVAEAYLQPNASNQAETAAALDRVTAVCAKQFNIDDPDLLDVVGELGTYGAVADYLTNRLMDLGADDDALMAVFDFYDALEDQDFDLLYDTEWRDNADLVAKFRNGLVEAGLPNSEPSLKIGLELIELLILSDMAAFDLSLWDLTDNSDQSNP